MDEINHHRQYRATYERLSMHRCLQLYNVISTRTACSIVTCHVAGRAHCAHMHDFLTSENEKECMVACVYCTQIH